MLSAAIVVTPSTVVNARDCGALVTIAAAFSILLSLLIYAARLSTRWPWRTLLGYDDLVTSVATVCSLHVYVNHDLIRLQALSVAQSVVAIRAVSAGLGVVPEDLSESAQQHAEKVSLQSIRPQTSGVLIRNPQLVFAAETIFIVVVYVCKIAVSLLLHRLASQRFKRIYAIAIIATCGACCLASVLAVAIQGTGTSWLSSQKNARSMVSGLSHRT